VQDDQLRAICFQYNQCFSELPAKVPTNICSYQIYYFVTYQWW